MAPPLHPVQFKYHLDTGTDKHTVEAVSAAGEPVGYMQWHASKTVPEPLTREPLKHTISDINVPQHSESGVPLRRQGIATGMWNYAHSQPDVPGPQHSPSRTPEFGDKWAKSVGGKLPRTPEQARLLMVGL